MPWLNESAQEEQAAEIPDAQEEVECVGDLQGPFLVGELAGDPIELKSGDIVEFGISAGDNDNIRPGRITMKPTTVQNALVKGCQVGTTLLIEDGMEVVVTAKLSDTELKVQILRGGKLKALKGVDVQDIEIDCAALTVKDLEAPPPPGTGERKVGFSQEAGIDSEPAQAMRKGTGVVAMRHLQEDEARPGSSQRKVSLSQEADTDSEPAAMGKGTGFMPAENLLESEDEKDEIQAELGELLEEERMEEQRRLQLPDYMPERLRRAILEVRDEPGSRSLAFPQGLFPAMELVNLQPPCEAKVCRVLGAGELLALEGCLVRMWPNFALLKVKGKEVAVKVFEYVVENDSEFSRSVTCRASEVSDTSCWTSSEAEEGAPGSIQEGVAPSSPGDVPVPTEEEAILGPIPQFSSALVRGSSIPSPSDRPSATEDIHLELPAESVPVGFADRDVQTEDGAAEEAELRVHQLEEALASKEQEVLTIRRELQQQRDMLAAQEEAEAARVLCLWRGLKIVTILLLCLFLGVLLAKGLEGPQRKKSILFLGLRPKAVSIAGDMRHSTTSRKSYAAEEEGEMIRSITGQNPSYAPEEGTLHFGSHVCHLQRNGACREIGEATRSMI